MAAEEGRYFCLYIKRRAVYLEAADREKGTVDCYEME